MAEMRMGERRRCPIAAAVDAALRRIPALLAPAMGLFLSSSAQAQTLTWNNAAGGSFHTASNWTPAGPPGAANTANFNLNNTYTVSFTSGVLTANLTQSQGNV